MLSPYEPADLLFFAGTNWESRVIALATCSPWQLLKRQWFSHVGIIAPYHDRLLIFESTTLCDEPCEIQKRRVHGPQAHEPAGRVASYRGKVWRLRLDPREKLARAQALRLSDYCASKIGDGYDYDGAGVSGTRLLRLARFLRPSLDKLFCSEYALGALRDVGVVDKDINAASYNPARLARDLQWWGTYQWLGTPGSERLK